MNNKLISYIKNEVQTLPGDNIGLFTGKAGCSLALYVINSKVKDPDLGNIADILLKETMEASSSCRDLSLDKGLTGVGLAINYLISNGYIEGDSDEVLSDIDALLYKNLKDENIRYGISCTSGLVGYLVYLVERMSHGASRNTLFYKINEASLRTVVNKLGMILPAQFVAITKDVYTSLIYNYPILFIYLRKSLDLDVYSEKICNMVKSWSTYLISYIPYYNINKLYMAVALAYLNRKIADNLLDRYVHILIFSTDMEALYKEIDAKIMNVNEGFFFVEILLQAAKRLFADTDFENQCNVLYQRICERFVPLYREYLQTIPPSDFNLHLINGFLGVECVNALYPSLFRLDA